MLLTLPPYAFSRPDILLLLGLLPLFWLWQWRAFRSLAIFVSLLLHSLVFGCIVLAAAGLHTFRPGAASIPVLVLDLSQSVTADQRQWMRNTITQRIRPTADTPTIVFAGTHKRLRWQEAEALLTAPSADLQRTETNLAGALTPLLHNEPNRHIYLFSDGWEVEPQTTRDDASSADANSAATPLLLPLLKAHGLKLYPFLFPPAQTVPNVTLQRFDLPPTTASGESALLRVALDNTNPGSVRGELVVTKRDKEVWRQSVTLSPGASLLTHPVVFSADDSGLIPLRATFTPSTPGEDANPQDNRATAWVTVAEKEKILLLSAKAQDNRYLERVFRGRGLGVTAINVADQPAAALGALGSYKAIILNNVARTRLPATLLTGLEGYVRGGGGFIMIGGEESLGLGGYKGTEVERILPLTLVPPQKKDEPRTAVMLVIDTSGSMRREAKLLYAKEGARAVAHNLKDKDYFGVIGFDTEPFVVIPLSLMATIREDVEYRLNRLKASGGTFLFPALEEAKRQIERQSATRKHIIILTDGETGGSGSDYIDLVSAMHREGKIIISAIAVGEEPNLRLMSRVADYGGGAFHHTIDPSTLADLFIDELQEKKKPEEKTMVERDLVPIPNPASPFLKDLATREFPPLKGYVETQVKPGARTDVSLRTNDKRPPLAASWSYGQGKAMAFTSDANGRWSAPWVGWEGFSQFWSQALQWCLPERKAEEQKETHFSATLGHSDAGLVIDLFSYGVSEEGGAASAHVQEPSEKSAGLSLQRLAPGHYQGVYRTTKAGDYRVDITSPSGERLGLFGYTVPPPRVAEVSQPQPNLSLLEALARATGGTLNPDVSSLVQPVAPPEPFPLLPYLIPLAMALYFVELLVRRMG
ncbi:MAG: VWA domain-containing protein [Deltaproteobacteria bacterium]|nr:VWA domain-containing protein [Deltaproteobacteria bacterium]